MTPQELKSSILQLAVQGRLVEQRPEEGTAEELYRQIQEEKQNLIKEGKIKKEKPLPEITEDEVPFDIPESWKWVRLGDIVSRNPKNSLDDELEVSFIPMNCVFDGYRNQHTFEIKKWGQIKKGFTHFANGDIGIAKITPCFQNRKSVIFSNLEKGVGAGTTELSVIRVIKETILAEYVLWFVKTDYFISNGVKSFSGTAGQQRIDKDYISNCLFPLPPLAEQKRIVAKIEELLPYIDRYEKAWSKLEDFNKRFPGDMQKSVLQMAIQGKLVEQRPEEGTGEELYRQIQAEKQSLIKSGKIKKEKPLPEISEDEIPFDIPDSWKWVRLRDLGVTQTGNTPPKSHPEYFGQDIPFITPGDIALTNIDYNNQGISFYGENVARICNADSILQVCIGGSIGKAAITNRKVAFNQQINTITPLQCLSEYLFSVFQSAYFITTMKEKAGGTATPIINRGLWDKLLIPLPPLAEQKRIVQKLEEILPLCEKLK